MGVNASRMGRYARAAPRWGRLLIARKPAPGVRVFYGREDVPAADEPAAGGTAKLQRLATRFPNHPTDFTLLYVASNWLPRDLEALLWLARRRGIPVVLNQDGVGYPAWAGAETETVNQPIRKLLGAADHVLYQSDFCKRSADRWVGEPAGSWEVLHNAVDVARFRPAKSPPPGGPVLLLGGDQSQTYRLELGIRTLAALIEAHPDAQLLVTGRLAVPIEPLVGELGLSGRVHALGRYAQRDAPALYQRAHLLLHTKVNDPCPSVVLEAMASGLPVVFPRSGGVPELVGDEAGIGVPHADSWDRDEPPPPEALADAVACVLRERETYAVAARTRAVERFALEPWLERHAELFARLAPR
jgi:glycosyltransferase involved in cell wall biosynthesis